MAKALTGSGIFLPTWFFPGFGIMAHGTIHEISRSLTQVVGQIFGGLL